MVLYMLWFCLITMYAYIFFSFNIPTCCFSVYKILMDHRAIPMINLHEVELNVYTVICLCHIHNAQHQHGLQLHKSHKSREQIKLSSQS